MELSTENIWLHFLENMSDGINSVVSKSGQHSVRVANLGKTIAEKMGIWGNDLHNVYWGAMLHEVGKIGIPKEILSKSGPLSAREWVMMETHPTIEANIVLATKSLKSIIPIIQTHQERFDGKGYPHGIDGEKIPLGARVLSVVDAYDAMTDDRPYRDACSHEDAILEIKRYQGSQFDPQVVDVFVEIMDDRN
jgi:HD-GYP domain-containing protein (c-di-GMP phosphodiesterase class II)